MRFNSCYITKSLLVLFAGVVLVSCVTTRTLTIEIPEKAKKELSENIQSLVIISRVMNDSYSDFDTDTLQRIFYRKGFNSDTIINDYSVIDTTLKALGDLLYESGRYDIVIPEDRLLENNNSLPMARELTWSEVQEWCDTFKTDAVLSLDYFKTRVITSYDKLVNFNPLLNDFQNLVYAEMKINYEALFRIYDPSKQRVVVRSLLQDTLFWENTDRTTADLFYHLTPVKDALTEAGITVALDFSGEISPVWKTEKRKYFASGNENMKKAALLVENNQWKEAMELWKKTAESARSKSLKSRAEFNLAVGNEISGNIDTSVSWALQSFNSMFRTITYEYLETLRSRKTELQKKKP